MAIPQVDADIARLLATLEASQWNHATDFALVGQLGVTTREDLRTMPMARHYYSTKTSGSTGQPVTVQKTYDDHVWHVATNIREVRWRNWDVTKNIGIVRPGSKRQDQNFWGIPRSIEPVQGMAFQIGYQSISELQQWLEEKNPHYLHCAPSIVAQLNLSKASNLIDCKGTGELGGSLYSSEECGTISIQCPENPIVHHVMENQIVEVDAEGAMLITTLTNPYIRRYKHGDHVELGACSCGRKLQTISKIHGRVRNMLVLPGGDRKWPLFGSRDYYTQFGIKQFKLIQTALDQIEVQIIAPPLGEREAELIAYVQRWLEVPINITVKHVASFGVYKFEEFVSLVG